MKGVRVDQVLRHAIVQLNNGKFHVASFEIYLLQVRNGEPGSSVSIMSGYGLDDQAIEVQSSAEVRGFSCSLCVQTGSGAHPDSYTIGTEGPFPGGKARPGRDADPSPPT
jgi:hypothetical protein